MLTHARLIRLAPLLAATAVGLVACGGGSGSTPPPATAQAHMKLSVGDAPPADNATHVVVEFTGVELTGNNGNPVTINFDQPKTIDLMTDSGTASAVLFDQPIAPGSYGQIRLMVTADGTANNSYIDFADGSRMGIRIPSGAQTGLKLVSGFTVPDSGVVDYTVDFDLRKSITCPPGQGNTCILKPAMRLVDNTSVGNIQGQVTSTLPTGCSPGVYLYHGDATRLEDMDDSAPSDDVNQPIASKAPVANSSPPYYYQFTFLPPGTYKVAFSCQADQDAPDAHDASVVIAPVATTDVTAATTQTVDVALGSIMGQVTTPNGPISSSNPLPTGCVPGAYLYAGTVTAPEDWNNTSDAADTNQPLMSVLPTVDSPPAPYGYQFAGLPAGTYTLAATCQADQDLAGQSDPAVTFNPVTTVTVTADAPTPADLQLP